MTIILNLLLVVGLAVALWGFVQLLIEAFKTHPVWGVFCLLFPPVGLLFLAAHWKKGYFPFYLMVLGCVLMLAVRVFADLAHVQGVPF